MTSIAITIVAVLVSVKMLKEITRIQHYTLWQQQINLLRVHKEEEEAVINEGNIATKEKKITRTNTLKLKDKITLRYVCIY